MYWIHISFLLCTYLIIHLFKNCLLSTCYVPDAVLDVSDVARDKDLCPNGTFMLVEEERQKGNLTMWPFTRFWELPKKERNMEGEGEQSKEDSEYGERKPQALLQFYVRVSR